MVDKVHVGIKGLAYIRRSFKDRSLKDRYQEEVWQRAMAVFDPVRVSRERGQATASN